MYQITLSVAQRLSEYMDYLGDINWVEVATVVIAGVGIVLGVLIVLIFVFYLFGLIVSSLEGSAKKNKAKAKTVPIVEVPVASIKTAPKAVAPAPVVEQGISNDVVAAITAAITASEGSGNFVIRSVKRKDVGSRNPWARAGISDNTRSF